MSREFALLKWLSSAQRKAVTAPRGHLCINAAAGTGKTSTVAARILWLQLVQGVPPEAILAVTFSRAARTHLLDKVEAFTRILGAGSAVPTFTLHGLAYRILRIAIGAGETWLRPGFKVMAAGRDRINPILQEHAADLLRDLSDPWDLPTRVEQYSRALDAVRQGCADIEEGLPLEPDDLPDGVIYVPARIETHNLRKVWRRYNAILQARNCLDYPGMVTEAILSLYRSGKTLRRARSGLEYIIVDEYQDTSRAQEELIQLLVDEWTSVTVVGDSDQAIYTFNGADIGNILHFAERILETGSALPVLEPVHLVENYRSSARILNAANRVLDRIHGPGRKQLVPYPGTVDEPVESYRRRNLEVVRVLSRSLDQAASWAAAEIARLVNEEGVEPSDIAVLVRKDTEHSPQGRKVREALDRLGIRAEEQDRDPVRTARVYEVVRDLCGDPDYYGEAIGRMIERITAGEFRDALGDVTPEEAMALLREAEAAGAEYAGEVADFVFEQGAPDATPASLEGVQVRTVHSAKGLEFRVVFLLYVADREFPHGANPDLAEERRLYYVGLTRAQERLYVLGEPGAWSENFFDAIAGSGVVTVHAEPRPTRPQSSEDSVDDETVRLIQEARRRQQEIFRRRPQR